MDLDTKIRMAENELKAWVAGTISNNNILRNFYPDQPGAWYIATEEADAWTIRKLTNGLEALYLIRKGRKN